MSVSNQRLKRKNTETRDINKHSNRKESNKRIVIENTKTSLSKDRNTQIKIICNKPNNRQHDKKQKHT